MRRPALLRRALLAFALAAGCATSSSRQKSDFQFRPDLPLSTWYPLAPTTAWGYDVTDEATGEKILLVNRVLANQGGRITIVSGGDPQTIEDRGTALVRLPSGNVLLQSPLVVDARWAIEGGQARITALDARVETSAGVYPSCLVVEETTDEQRVVTAFAPQVGPVRVEIFARGPAGEKLLWRGLLRSYHKAGDELP